MTIALSSSNATIEHNHGLIIMFTKIHTSTSRPSIMIIAFPFIMVGF